MNQTTLVNLALSKIGDRLVKSFGDTTTKEGRLATLHYEPVLREVLRAHFWPWATAVRELVEVEARATLTDKQWKVTAKDPGPEGNLISVGVVEGEIENSVTVEGKAISVKMGTRKRMRVSAKAGTVLGPKSPEGIYYHAMGTPDSFFYPGTRLWTTNGILAQPAAGIWGSLTQVWMVLPVSVTVEELAPRGIHTATYDPDTATMISVNIPGFGAQKSYWLFSGPPGGSSRWVDLFDGTYANANEVTIPAGNIVHIARGGVSGFLGGVGLAIQNNPATRWMYYLQCFFDGSLSSSWFGYGVEPESVDWQPVGETTGTPVIAAAGVPPTLDEVSGLFSTTPEVVELVDFELVSNGYEFTDPKPKRNLSGGFEEEEIHGFSNSFFLPKDFLKLKELRIKETGEKIERFALRRVAGKSCVLCDEDAVVLEYVAEVDEPAVFDPLFVAAFTMLFAARLARAISGNDGMEAKFLQAYEQLMLPGARTASAQDFDSNENHPLREFLDGNLTQTRGDFF